MAKPVTYAVISGAVVAIVVIIALVMMNAHPSLAEIVENKDCQELGKYDQRMDETYGFDVKKMKVEESISNELWSDAMSLYWDCSFDAVKSMYGNDSPDDDDTKNRDDILREAAVIIHKRDCKQFVEWYDDNTLDIGQLSSERYGYNEADLDSYHKYCKDPNTVLSENGIDVEEKWDYSNPIHSGYSDAPSYYKWDRSYKVLYLSEIEETLRNIKSSSEVISEAAEIIKERDCKQFVEWYTDNIDHVSVLDFDDDHIIELSYDHAELELYNLYCENPNTVLDDNGIDMEEKWIYYHIWDER